MEKAMLCVFRQWYMINTKHYHVHIAKITKTQKGGTRDKRKTQ